MVDNYQTLSGMIDAPSAEMREIGETSVRDLYQRLMAGREPYLIRARLNSKLTIPWLVPDIGVTAATQLPTPFQSVGARGVNNLSAKLMMALFPPNAPWFQFKVDPFALEQISQVPNAQTELEQNLLKASEAILTELETSGFRTVAHEVMRHLLVSGNALLCYSKYGVRAFHLDQFVVERDPSTGRQIRIITHEKIPEDSVPSETGMTPQNYPMDGARLPIVSTEKTHDLYTHAYWECLGMDPEKGKWVVYQECDNVYVTDSYGEYSEEDFEYFALRGNVSDRRVRRRLRARHPTGESGRAHEHRRRRRCRQWAVHPGPQG